MAGVILREPWAPGTGIVIPRAMNPRTNLPLALQIGCENVAALVAAWEASERRVQRAA